MNRDLPNNHALALAERLVRIHSLAKICAARLCKELRRMPDPAVASAVGNLLGSELENPRKLFSRPIVDMTAMTVTWRGERCPLGHTRLLDLMDRIVRNSNRWLGYDRLKEEVWHRDRITDEAVKVAVTRLRGQLRQHGMADLAKAIVIRGYQCGFFPDGLHE